MLSQTLLTICIASIASAAPAAVPTTTAPAPAPLTPSTFLKFNNTWALQLPVGTAANPTVVAVINNPALKTFTSPNFYVNNDKTGVVFYTPNTGITLSGGHPRTELRQMTGATGQLQAAWKSADSVRHDFNLTAKIDFVSSPRFVIFSQVFAASEGCQYNFRAINLGGTNNPYSIYVCGQSGCVEMDGHYVPGSLFTLQLSASNNVVKVNYKNLVSQAVWQKDMPLVPYNDYYYKAGSYCQVTTSTDPANAYCQVTFNALSVTW